MDKILYPSITTKVAVIGKYTEFKDSYVSIFEALTHAGIANDCKVKVSFIAAEDLEKENGTSILRQYDGILVPGGFGDRGIEGKINAVRYARENDVPFLGICLGLQLAVIEFARNVCGIEKATSREFDENSNYSVIDLLPEQLNVLNKGGTMRLGAYPCQIKEGSVAHSIYGESLIFERHRHRFEVNNLFLKDLVANGLSISGKLKDYNIVEIIELSDHPFFIGTQFHPEFKSSPLNSHPIFNSFIKAQI